MQPNAMVASAVCKYASFDISIKKVSILLAVLEMWLITTIVNHAGPWIGPNLFIKVEKIFKLQNEFLS